MLAPPVRAPDFSPELEWLHTGGRAFSVVALRGRVALLDFWSYGCINCLHVVPELRELERRYGDALVVIGVHSGKFVAERETARIREATLRLGVAHPVVNDRHFRTWRAYAVRGWPTAVLLDRRGRVVLTRGGEFTADLLAPAIDALLAEVPAAGTDAPAPLPHGSERPAHAPGVLRHPGRVACDGWRLAIADTGHHRVLVGELADGGRRLRVTHVVGGDAAGLLDGALAEARFTAPQGLAFDGHRLAVADAGNHAVRLVDLAGGTVRTLAGTGRRPWNAADRAAGAIASPWAVAWQGSTLMVALAGEHRLLALDEAASDAPRARVHAGQGGEALRDDRLADALLAQPMGLASGVASDAGGTGGGTSPRLWFADAETSAIRAADVDADGHVETLVGTGLFDFGDRDGTGDLVRLQHAQDVALDARSGRLLVCDTYNDALKWLDPATRTVTTWVRGLHEPGGVALGADVAYVADTNAHRVAVVDRRRGAVTTLAIDLGR